MGKYIMIGDKLTKQKLARPTAQTQNGNLDDREQLYQFLLETVKTQPSEQVLIEFERAFLYPSVETTNDRLFVLLKPLLSTNQEQDFRNTLKRSCYILVNNWEIVRNYSAIQQLVQLFADPVLSKPSVSPLIRRLRGWLKNFVESQDFQDLKLFAARYNDRATAHWSDRYVSYLLVPQYVNLDNPFEQRQAARTLYKRMKEQFKFDLAMYTAHAGSAAISSTKFRNPTYLGDDVVLLIKRIVLKQGFFNYPHLARSFIHQTQPFTYQEFKHSLIDYLIFSIDGNKVVETLKGYLSEKLTSLYTTYNDSPIDSSLRLRTANRLIDYLTTEDRHEPTSLFVLLLSGNASLTLVIILLKIILMSRYSRTHLEARIADLIKYYENYSEEECRWIIHFIEVFNIAMTIHTENVEYSLVNMAKDCSGDACNPADYRIFSQLKQAALPGDSDWLELAAIESLGR